MKGFTMKKIKLTDKKTVLLLPLGAFAVSYIFSVIFIFLINKTNYTCISFMLTGLYCPGCGGTRAVSELIKGHILLSLRNNPLVVTASVILILKYIQLFCRTFGHEKIKIPAGKAFYFILAGILTVFYILRNFIPALQPV